MWLLGSDWLATPALAFSCAYAKRLSLCLSHKCEPGFKDHYCMLDEIPRMQRNDNRHVNTFLGYSYRSGVNFSSLAFNLGLYVSLVISVKFLFVISTPSQSEKS